MAPLGGRATVDALFERYRSWLRRWARGRLPVWVRGAVDTSDLVQDTLHRTFARIERFEPKHANALQIYLRRSVENQIRDELRRAVRRRASIAPDDVTRLSEEGAPQHRKLVDDETWSRYLDGLTRLTARERRLIVGHAELEYSYQQLALIENLPSPRRGPHGAAAGGDSAEQPRPRSVTGGAGAGRLVSLGGRRGCL